LPWSGHYLWTGIFDPATFSFSALIGNCQNPVNCNYNDLVEGFGGFTNPSSIGFEVIANSSSAEIHGPFRFGRYCVVVVDAGCIQAVPEPKALWLLLIAAVVTIFKSRRSILRALPVAVLLFAAAPAQAVSTNFNIFFEHHFPATGVVQLFPGTYTITDGKLTAFDAVLDFACGGNPPRLCDFHVILDSSDPMTGQPVVGTDPYPSFGGILDRSIVEMFAHGLFPNQNGYDVRTPGPDFFSERYFVAATPEPSALWLLLAGALLFPWIKGFNR
jgi:hypothetical protein